MKNKFGDWMFKYRDYIRLGFLLVLTMLATLMFMNN